MHLDPLGPPLRRRHHGDARRVEARDVVQLPRGAVAQRSAGAGGQRPRPATRPPARASAARRRRRRGSGGAARRGRPAWPRRSCRGRARSSCPMVIRACWRAAIAAICADVCPSSGACGSCTSTRRMISPPRCNETTPIRDLTVQTLARIDAEVGANERAERRDRGVRSPECGRSVSRAIDPARGRGRAGRRLWLSDRGELRA